MKDYIESYSVVSNFVGDLKITFGYQFGITSYSQEKNRTFICYDDEYAFDATLKFTNNSVSVVDIPGTLSIEDCQLYSDDEPKCVFGLEIKAIEMI